MEACVVICRTAKPKARKGRILFINAVNEVTRERAQSFLTDDHLGRVVKAYQRFKDEPGFTRVATLEEIRAKEGNLSIPLYVAPSIVQARTKTDPSGSNFEDSLSAWLKSSCAVRESLSELLTNSPSRTKGRAT